MESFHSTLWKIFIYVKKWMLKTAKRHVYFLENLYQKHKTNFCSQKLNYIYNHFIIFISMANKSQLHFLSIFIWPKMKNFLFFVLNHLKNIWLLQAQAYFIMLLWAFMIKYLSLTNTSGYRECNFLQCTFE